YSTIRDAATRRAPEHAVACARRTRQREVGQLNLRTSASPSPADSRSETRQLFRERAQAGAGGRIVGLPVGARLALAVVVTAAHAVQCPIDDEPDGGIDSGFQRADRSG